ncbi:putative F-box associated interaction domain-containing protein [Helianthus debilis subsp. tardiflorus]
MTREVTRLRRSPYMGLSLCWGFGYDESTDDYKVIVKGDNQTCVRVMSLKSNVWRVIEEVKYKFISTTGILSHGALHWIVEDQNYKKLIISFDLSKEEFKEILQPADAGYEATYSSHLGIVKECLCIFRRSNCCFLEDLWMMKSYNVKGSWERLPHNHNMKHDIVHHLKGGVAWPLGTLEHHWGWKCGWKNTAAPIFVQSLVSPHVNGRPASAINIMSNSRVGSVDATPYPGYRRYNGSSIDTPPDPGYRRYNERPKPDKIRRGPFACALTLLKKHLVGSCNGLVCIFSYLRWTVLVGNPMTREVRRLNLPSILLFRSLCWGFGHDLSEDDYTVVVVDKKGENQTCFYLLSLKSNVWRVIGEVKYRLISKTGILCNGALHWIVGALHSQRISLV